MRAPLVITEERGTRRLPLQPTTAARLCLQVHAVFSVCFSAAHAARGTARHGVGSHAEPPTMECAAPVT